MAEKPSSTEGANASPEQTADAPGESDHSGNYDCNICLDTATDSVVTYCGHLFCWPCLHQWLSTRPDRQMCPVCKAGISKDKVVPIYGRGSTNNTDPREKLPPRPSAQRSEPERTGFGDITIGNLHLSFGIGAFPFSVFATTMNNRNGARTNGQAGTQQLEEERFLSKMFLLVAVFFGIWLIMA